MSNCDDIMGDQEYTGDMARLSFGRGVRISRRIFYPTSIAPTRDTKVEHFGSTSSKYGSYSLTTWANNDSAPLLADMC